MVILAVAFVTTLSHRNGDHMHRCSMLLIVDL
jgi:hypothetical protein